VEVKLHTLLALALDGHEWSASFTGGRAVSGKGETPRLGGPHSGSGRDSPLTQLEVSYRAPQGLQCLDSTAGEISREVG